MHEVDVGGVSVLVIGKHVDLYLVGLCDHGLRVVFFHSLIFLLDDLRLLEFPIFSELGHLLLKHAFEHHGLAAEDLVDLRYIGVVILLIDQTAAGAGAFVDMVVETEAELSAGDPLFIEEMAAGAQRIDIADQLEHHLCRLHVRVRSVIFSAECLVAGHENPRERLLGDYNPGIGFVVFEEHVISWLILLDHRVLKMQRVLFGVDHDEAHVDDIAHEQIGAHRVVDAVEV